MRGPSCALVLMAILLSIVLASPAGTCIGQCTGAAAAPDRLSAECTSTDGTGAARRETAERQITASRLSAIVDERMVARWQKDGVRPAPRADDAEFLRRIYLDLIGCIPRVSEAREFLDDARPEKRAELIDRLLHGQPHARHLSHVLRDMMMPEIRTNPDLAGGVGAFERWLFVRISEQVPYDHLVQELIATDVKAPRARGGRVRVLSSTPAPSENPELFFATKDNQPETVATVVARAFLGVSLECAQCHDHPFSRWRRDQFWGLAAFFSDLADPKAKPELTIPETTEVVSATYLDDTRFDAEAGQAPRKALATWITGPENQYFARATVNRIWATLFGIGLIQPIDDLASPDAVGDEELLDALAREFAAGGYDLNGLIQGIANSRTYQLSSRRTDTSQDGLAQFARMPTRAMSPEQFLESFIRATGHRPAARKGAELRTAALMESFAGGPADPTQGHTSILQALMMMNGELVSDVVSLERSELLAAVNESPFLDTPARVETLYLAALSRRPTAEELTRAVAYVEGGGATSDKASALGDVFWSLLNSAEFRLNH